MAFVTRKITRTSQPQEIVGLSDEYLNGSVIGLNFGASFNTNLAQYRRNRILPRASAGVKVSKDGRGIYCTDTTRALFDGDFGAPMVTSDGVGTGDFSISGVISPKSSTTRSPVFHLRYNTAAPFTQLFVITNGYYADNANTSTNEAGTLYAGSIHGVTGYDARGLKVTGVVNGQTLNFVYNRYASGYQELWVNGVLVASGTTVVNPVLAPGTQQFAIGGFAQATGFPYVDPTNLIYVANKAIDGEEISSNPWQILEPSTETIWIPDALAGGSVITIASGSSATAIITAVATSASVPTSSAGSSTASTITGSSKTSAVAIDAAGMTTSATLGANSTSTASAAAANGISTATTLAGSSLTAGSSSISSAFGVSVASTLIGAPSSAASLTSSAGQTTTNTLASSATASSDLIVSSGATTAGALAGATGITIVSGSMVPASSTTSASVFASSAVAASVAIAAAGASSAAVMASNGEYVSSEFSAYSVPPHDMRYSVAQQNINYSIAR